MRLRTSARLTVLAAAFVGLAATGPLACTIPVKPRQTADFILRNARVIDTEAGTTSAPQDIAITDGVIIRIGSLKDWRSETQVDLEGQFVMAGLWDLHVHLEAYTPEGAPKLEPLDWHVPLAMSYGVLGLRDLGSRTDDILALRNTLDARRKAGLAAPLLKVAGQSFSGRQPWGDFDHTLLPETPVDAERMVSEQIARGVDFIKTHDFIAPDIYAAITRAAATQKVKVVGHLRSYSGPLQSIASGQRDFDHLPPELLAYCGDDGERVTEAFYAGWYTGGPGYYERGMAAMYEPASCATLFAAMASEGASVTPTLSVRAPVSDRAFAAAQMYLPESYLDLCKRAKDASADAPGEDRAAYTVMTSDVVRALSGVGVALGTGTDGSPERCAVPGLVLLDELDQLNAAGLTPAQVLDAATRVSASIAGAARSGRVAEGFAADLVILGANPLSGLSILHSPSGIVSAGDYLGAVQIAGLKTPAARAANR